MTSCHQHILSPTYVIKITEIYFWKRACGKYATKNNPSEASSPFNVHNFKSIQSYFTQPKTKNEIQKPTFLWEIHRLGFSRI